jgi:predicted Zn-ribbon and HTH transcriptional regulator
VLRKIEVANDKTGYLAEEVSKRNTTGAPWILLMWEKRGELKKELLGKKQKLGALKNSQFLCTAKKIQKTYFQENTKAMPEQSQIKSCDYLISYYSVYSVSSSPICKSEVVYFDFLHWTICCSLCFPKLTCCKLNPHIDVFMLLWRSGVWKVELDEVLKVKPPWWD